jgi:hypothetical protein
MRRKTKEEQDRRQLAVERSNGNIEVGDGDSANQKWRSRGGGGTPTFPPLSISCCPDFCRVSLDRE